MPPLLNSRYERTYAVEDVELRPLTSGEDELEEGVLYLTEREPFRFDENLPGTRRHRVAEGDTLQILAYRYFQGVKLSGSLGPEHLWWIIADFQPVPILDPTIDLEVGRLLYIPGVPVIKRKVFGGVRT